MGRPRKDPQRRQNRATVDLVPDSDVVLLPDDAPKPDRGWLLQTKRDWTVLWSAQLAIGTYEVTDEPGVRRLFCWRDDLTRARQSAAASKKEAAKNPVVEGSKGQPVASPHYAIADSFDAKALSIEKRIRALEDRLGLSPKARLNLGITQLEGMNLAQQNALLAQRLEGAARDRVDPRTPSTATTDPRDPRPVRRDTPELSA